MREHASAVLSHWLGACLGIWSDLVARFVLLLQIRICIKGGNACAGLVFLAFALNLVDCGGMLGGRLGDGRRREKRARPPQPARMPKRTFTM